MSVLCWLQIDSHKKLYQQIEFVKFHNHSPFFSYFATPNFVLELLRLFLNPLQQYYCYFCFYIDSLIQPMAFKSRIKKVIIKKCTSCSPPILYE